MTKSSVFLRLTLGVLCILAYLSFYLSMPVLLLPPWQLPTGCSCFSSHETDELEQNGLQTRLVPLSILGIWMLSL